MLDGRPMAKCKICGKQITDAPYVVLPRDRWLRRTYAHLRCYEDAKEEIDKDIGTQT